MNKEPGHIIQTPQPVTKMGAYTVRPFSGAETRLLSSVLRCDPRNHFGKHALWRQP